jgi:two-component system phosphate regulon sensor histidine kinase PhoR
MVKARMDREALRQWIRITVGPLFWIGAVQVAWTIVLILWISAFTAGGPPSASMGRGTMVAGLVLLGLMLVGVTVLVVHLARQVAHSRAVKDFISQVSHDLRSPLTTVKLHVETLLRRELSPEQSRACLDAASQELERLERGIEGVLMASRLERQRLQIVARPVPLADFLASYLEAKRDSIALRGAQIEHAPMPVLVVSADPSILEKMLDNLIENAILHCQPGVRIRVSVAEQSRCAVVSVSDDGPGLPRREWRRVFSMFYRGPKGRRHRKGTGLGLFIVAGIAKAHGGRAWVESDGPGRGCQFRVALPLAEAAQP